MYEFDPDLSNLRVTEEDTAQISACLQRLLADTGASYTMVVDRSGQILAYESDGLRPEMTHLGALLAATYASTQEIARILNEDSFRTLLQEGLREKIITETVANHWLLVIIFDQQAHLGLIKVLAKRTTSILGNVLEVAQSRPVSENSGFSRRMLQATTDTIDLVFSDDEAKDRDEEND
ncbi:MAG: roadblock/LC7 domain-containing protein [Sphaerobacteraceae bacterium]|nr:MAG: roadblock/LC7 domain-containing protein [Sphaerobacteraceae bacterium]